MVGEVAAPSNPQADALRLIAYDKQHGITPTPQTSAAAHNADAPLGATLTPAQKKHNDDVLAVLRQILNKPAVQVPVASHSAQAADIARHMKRNGLTAKGTYTALPSSSSVAPSYGG